MNPILLVLLAITCLLASCRGSDSIPIRISPYASETLEFAAVELQKKLQEIYPGYSFPITKNESAYHRVILLQSSQGKGVVDHTGGKDLKPVSGAFQVKHNNQSGSIIGYDDLGVLYGVYALLENLGYDFQLSFDVTPEPFDRFSLEKWSLSDAPLQEDRIIFNWHNFLSGCTGWDLEDWQNWMLQSVKLGFNSIMIHTYGNNPIHGFRHNGVSKPLGYLSSTMKGRDWGTQHVNDVRRLYGGKVFEEPVFGSEAALAKDEMREDEAVNLMKKVFEYEDILGLRIYFAFDIDTESANPQRIIETLPEESLLRTPDGFSLVNPETEEGMKYYTSLLNSLLETYPQIDEVVIWTRKYNPNPDWMTPVRSMTIDQFPGEWKSEYAAILDKHPEHRDDVYAPSAFVLGKIIRTFQQAITESVYKVGIGSGSWEFGFLPTAGLFYPTGVKLLPLDFKVIFELPETRGRIASVANNRKVMPIVWAHHDDHRYIGKPYTPYENFQTKLNECGSSGFGIIHWLTRPLDLYFKSLSRQVWESTINQEVEILNTDFASKLSGEGEAGFSNYLNDWLLNAPMFGRETSDCFMDYGKFIVGESPSEPGDIIRGVQRRLEMLEQVDRTRLTAQALPVIDYYANLERFYEAFLRDHGILYEANQYWELGQKIKARELIGSAHPEQTIELFSKLTMGDQMTRGEQAMIISLNLRWLPDFIDQKQLCGLEPIRINFQPTSHDPLAQAPGKYTYFVDEKREFWIGMGENEIGNVKASSTSNIIHQTNQGYIRSQKPIFVPLKTFRERNLPEGTYSMSINLPVQNSGTTHISIIEEGELILKESFSSGVDSFNLEFEIKGGDLQLSIDPGENEILLSSMVLTQQINI
jgi:hypothetical protein